MSWATFSNYVRIASIFVFADTKQIDLSGTVGHLIASLLFGIAETERQHIKERQAAGIAVAKAKGLTVQEIAHALNVSERTVFRYLAP